MSRHFNGTSDRGSITVDLSAFNMLSVSFWLWWDVFANNDKLVCEYTANTLSGSNAGFFIDPNTSNVGFQQFSICQGFGGSKAWQDIFTRPSAAAWHHYLVTFNRVTPVNTAWVDGAAQTLTAVSHTGSAFGNFGNSTLNMMCRNQASLFGAGRLAEWTMWGGVILGAAVAKGLATGATPPQYVHPDNLLPYVPIWGADSPEPDYSGKQKSMTIVGTTLAAHPPVMPGLNRINRSFQPMPV